MATKKKTTKKKKAPSLKSQARTLAKNKYAPALSLLKSQRSANRKLYDTSSSQRVNALNAEMGSLSAADATAQARLVGLKTETSNAFQQAMAQAQQENSKTQAARVASNSSALSSLQAEAKARGLSGVGDHEVAQRLNAQNAAADATSAMNEGALQRLGLSAQESLSGRQSSATMLSNTAKSSARGDAQRDLDEKYNTYWQERMKIQAEQAAKKLEQGGYENEMYLTLKEKKAAEKAAAAAAKLAQQTAAANLGYKYDALQSNTQYKYDALKSNTQYKYDALEAKKAQNDITNKLKKLGIDNKRAKDAAEMVLKNNKFNLDVSKFNWTKANKNVSSSSSTSELVAALIGSIK